MGNDLSSTSIDVNVTSWHDNALAKQREAMRPGGAFREYRRARLERDLTCSHPLLRTSIQWQEACVDAQMRTIEAQLAAMEKTDGYAFLVDRVWPA